MSANHRASSRVSAAASRETQHRSLATPAGIAHGSADTRLCSALNPVTPALSGERPRLIVATRVASVGPMDPGMVRLAGEQLNRASARDDDLKTAARLLLADLEKVESRLVRAVEQASKVPLGDDLLPNGWDRHLESFARLYSRAETQDWEQLRKLLDVRGYLESKRVVGSEGPLDVREQGWVWFLLLSLRAALRPSMQTFTRTSWWRRRLGVGRRDAVAAAIRMGTRAAATSSGPRRT